MSNDKFNLILDYKKINDCIHGFFTVSNLACLFIDTKYFQRLREQKQLATCFYVFQNSNHTRFEHSLGVYYLAGKILNRINKVNKNMKDYLLSIKELQKYYEENYKDPDIILDDFICELIKIAALLHDIGHGPFSHLYDDYFVENKEDIHEIRSGKIIKYIIQNNKILSNLITDDLTNFIINIINPDEANTGFIYQIVSNNLNTMDVDKYDYIIRDAFMVGFKTGFDYSRMIEDILILDNDICFPKQISYEIKKLFSSRYDLYRQLYTHKAVVSTQLMLLDIMLLIKDIINLSQDKKEEFNIEHFCKLTDDYILKSLDYLNIPLIYNTFTEINKNNINKATEILNNLREHKFYKCVYNSINDRSLFLLEDFKDLDINLEKIRIYSHKIGYVSGNKKNPLENIYVYNSKNNSKIKINMNEITQLIPVKYQEYVNYIFYTDKEDVESIIKLTNYIESKLCEKI
jgi:HD superfamily phosphohydrolase